MPIYEFECPKCEEIFEKICSMGVVETECPECKTLSKKIISPANFKCDKFAYKPLKKSRPKSYVPTLHDLKLDPESKRKNRKDNLEKKRYMESRLNKK